MRLSRAAIAIVCGAIGLTAGSAAGLGRALNRVPPARAPCMVLSGHPCHQSFCDVYPHGPCFPYYAPPLGESRRLTITSTDSDPGEKSAADVQESADDHTFNSIRDVFVALRACWVPLAKDEARHCMEYTIRFALNRDGDLVAPPRMTFASHDAPRDVRAVYRGAIEAALERGIPLHFNDGMEEAVVGCPIAVRFVDDRTIDQPNDAL
jgi:hypothetical protein